MQVLNLNVSDTKTTGFRNGPNGNFIEGFLIGSKRNKNKWKINKNTLTKEKVTREFKNKDFIIIPEKIAHGIDAHYHGSTKQETQEGYRQYSHGKITEVLGPWPYKDDPNEFYYTHITKLNNSKSAALLTELGPNTNIPFATSPHIWDESKDVDFYSLDVTDFTGIGVALVHEGAYGDIAVINKMCVGSQNQCTRSLGAGAANQHYCGCCSNDDANIAKILSSHFSKAASAQISMSDNNTSNNNNNSQQSQQQPTSSSIPNDGITKTYIPTNTAEPANTTVNPQNTLTNEPKKDDNKIVVTKEEYDRINKELAESQTLKKDLEKLRNERNEEKLTKVFANNVADENVLKELIKKHRDNADYVSDLYAEFNKHIVPSIIEKAKQDYQKELDTKAQEATKRSRGAALRPEPKPKVEDSSQDKAASVQNTNEVALLRKYLRGVV